MSFRVLAIVKNMRRRKNRVRVRVSITLSLELVSTLDSARAGTGESRSEVYERYLRRGLESEARKEMGFGELAGEVRRLRHYIERSGLRAIAVYILFSYLLSSAEGKEKAEELRKKAMKIAREVLFKYDSEEKKSEGGEKDESV